MAVIMHVGSGEVLTLLPEHVVGRSENAALRLDLPFVSSQHAALRWTGERWEARDLGSRNGTWVNEHRLVPGQAHHLRPGDRLRFGQHSQDWSLIDDTAPGTMVMPLSGGLPLTTDGGILAVPSADHPDVTIYSDADGSWQLEHGDEAVTRLVDGQIFHAGGRPWRFHAPRVVHRTTSPDEIREIGALQLFISVSRDEEHVELKAECSGRLQDLGARAHNYMILTLARQRLKDAEEGTADSACGWVYQDDLANALAIPATQLNIDVFRIRRQFAALDLIDVAKIIERRPRTKQLRIGTARITITTI